MSSFQLQSSFSPSGDQPEAIKTLVTNLRSATHEQVLLGVTGSGKTFTLAHAIAQVNRPTLVISHNKTLAGQLYQEFRDFFPKNHVSYFVSYYDYYQPEAFIPQSNTYIEKETEINDEIDKLRLAATTNILTHRDTIVVASVSCIYNIGSPKEYGHFALEMKPGMQVARESILQRLIQLQYERNNYTPTRGTFRVRGEAIDVFPASDDTMVRLLVRDGYLDRIEKLDTLTGKLLSVLQAVSIYPTKHYMTDPASYKNVFAQIRSDMELQIERFSKERKHIEARRIRERVNYDLDMLAEVGYVNGIENYSRYFDGRHPGDPPYTLFDFFDEAVRQDWLLIIDESHMTVPQIRGMYHGDRSRKQTLIDYGFRLPSALDNRPLKFDEFLRRIPQTIYVSATPDEWEISRSEGTIVEQLVRPTGLLDPHVDVRPTKGQIEDLMGEIQKRVASKERVLVTTLTKRMAEDLAKFLEERNIRVRYLHADVQTLDRSDILTDLRTGKFDVLVGINLLREGLDLPEVSLVAILDADKEGFLRSKISLIQTMGRAARHVHGKVILYADTETRSIKGAIDEVNRRRTIQEQYNARHGIVPKSIEKPIRGALIERVAKEESSRSPHELTSDYIDRLTPQDRKQLIRQLSRLMHEASRALQFEEAARLRDDIAKLNTIDE